jgi:ATP-dependent HslUV protease ATP-binding subunit HslU
MVVEVELEQRSTPFLNVFSNNGSLEELNQQFSDLLPTFFGGGKKKKSMTIGEAREKLKQDKEQGLIDMDKVHQVALERASQSGIIFLDEIDKIADSYDHQGPNVSREGVQRDLLPIIEGSTVNTKYGMIKTDHILFIAAGAFHISKPSDLMPELQGRFPIQVRLDNLTEQDFLRILTEPKNSLVKQIKALMATEDVHVTFDESGLRAIAAKAFDANEQTDNIGARRLHTITEQVIEDISFDADRLGGTSVLIDEAYVAERLSKRASRDALKDYIL